MVKLKRSDMRIFDDAFVMHQGYVLNFSDRTLGEFFEDEFGIEIYQEKYRFNGSSKAKHLRAFFTVEDEHTVSRVARKLWERRETLPQFQEPSPENEAVKRKLFALLERIEGGGSVPRMDAIDKFKHDETLEELVAAIDRDITRNCGGSYIQLSCRGQWRGLVMRRDCLSSSLPHHGPSPPLRRAHDRIDGLWFCPNHLLVLLDRLP
jgi:hypothetical protein